MCWRWPWRRYLIGIKDNRHAYQFYKLLLTVAPLWVLGLALLPGLVPAGAPGQSPLRRWPRLAAALPLGVVLVLGAGATGRLAWESASLEPRPRSNAHLVAADDMRKLQDLLEDGAGGDVLVGNSHPMKTTWLAYFARKSRVWLYSTVLIDANVIYVAEVRPRLDLRDLPAELRIVTEHGKLFSRVAPGDAELVWSGQTFQLWQARSRNWALPLGMRNAYGLEQLDGQPYFWVGGPPTELEILAARPGTITLSAASARAESSGTATRTLQVAQLARPGKGLSGLQPRPGETGPVGAQRHRAPSGTGKSDRPGRAHSPRRGRAFLHPLAGPGRAECGRSVQWRPAEIVDRRAGIGSRLHARLPPSEAAAPFPLFSSRLSR